MRNLKRALSLALASVMLLGMMVVGTSAASYPDVDENDNVEAIEVLNAVNVMIGRQGNFEPDEAVNRHEMAVIMAKLVLGVDTADNYVGTHPFTDVVPWADKYVAACYENGLIAGTSATTYGGGSPLTAVQAAAMMLRALGYKDLSVGATDWRAPVTAMANQIRLFNGVASNPSETLNRNQVAQLALNTLKSPMVNLKDNTISWTNGDGQIIMTGGSREYIVLSSREAYAQAINRVESEGTSASAIGGWTVELGEHLYNGKLRLDDDTDVFLRPARTWQYDGKKIGTYVKEELLRATYSTEVTGKTLYDLLSKNTISKYDFTIAIDGVDTDDVTTMTGYFTKGNLVSTNTRGVGATGKGVTTEVYVDSVNEEVTIAVINTYLAKAAEKYNEKRDEVKFNVWGLEQKSGPRFLNKDTAKNPANTFPLIASGEDFDVENVAKNDIVLVHVADNAIQEIIQPEVIDKTVLSSFSKGSWVNNGTKYDYANTARYDDKVLDQYSKPNMKELTYNLYLDEYGYMIGIERNEDPDQYVFLAGIDAGDSNLKATTADANVIHVDGTMKTVKVDMNKSTLPSYMSGDVNNSQLNTWCKYSVSTDGVYKLTEITYNAGADTLGQFAQDVAVYPDNGKTNKTITEKRTSLVAKVDDAGKVTDWVYGNDDTKYINVELNGVVVKDNVNGYKPADATGKDYRRIIDDVDTVITGIKDVDLEMTNLPATQKNDKGVSEYINPDAEIYTLYKEGIVIAAVTIGEDNGSAATWAYITSKEPRQEDYYHETDSSKAAEPGEWTWYREAVVDGKIVDLVEIGDSLTYIGNESDEGNMQQGEWWEIKVDADGNVRKSTLLSKVLGDRFQTKSKDVEETVNTESGDVVLQMDFVRADYKANKDTLTFKNGNLYTDSDLTKGFSVSRDVKVVLGQAQLKSGYDNGDGEKNWGDHGDKDCVDQWKYKDDIFEGYDGLKSVLDRLDANFVGDLNVIFHNGAATVIVINDIWGEYIDEGEYIGNKDNVKGDAKLVWDSKDNVWTLTVPADADVSTVAKIADYMAKAGCTEIVHNRNGWSFMFEGYYNEDQNVKVVKDTSKTYELTVDKADNGSVSYAKDGNKVTLTIEAKDGYKLATLMINGTDCASKVVDNKYSFTMTKDTTVTATFKSTTVVGTPVTVTFDAKGTATPGTSYSVEGLKDGKVEMKSGDTLTIKALRTIYVHKDGGKSEEIKKGTSYTTVLTGDTAIYINRQGYTFNENNQMALGEDWGDETPFGAVAVMGRMLFTRAVDGYAKLYFEVGSGKTATFVVKVIGTAEEGPWQFSKNLTAAEKTAFLKTLNDGLEKDEEIIPVADTESVTEDDVKKWEGTGSDAGEGKVWLTVNSPAEWTIMVDPDGSGSKTAERVFNGKKIAVDKSKDITITIKMMPNAGYTFTVTGAKADSSDESKYTVNLTADATVTVTSEKLTAQTLSIDQTGTLKITSVVAGKGNQNSRTVVGTAAANYTNHIVYPGETVVVTTNGTAINGGSAQGWTKEFDSLTGAKKVIVTASKDSSNNADILTFKMPEDGFALTLGASIDVVNGGTGNAGTAINTQITAHDGVTATWTSADGKSTRLITDKEPVAVPAGGTLKITSTGNGTAVIAATGTAETNKIVTDDKKAYTTSSAAFSADGVTDLWAAAKVTLVGAGASCKFDSTAATTVVSGTETGKRVWVPTGSKVAFTGTGVSFVAGSLTGTALPAGNKWTVPTTDTTVYAAYKVTVGKNVIATYKDTSVTGTEAGAPLFVPAGAEVTVKTNSNNTGVAVLGDKNTLDAWYTVVKPIEKTTVTGSINLGEVVKVSFIGEGWDSCAWKTTEIKADTPASGMNLLTVGGTAHAATDVYFVPGAYIKAGGSTLFQPQVTNGLNVENDDKFVIFQVGSKPIEVNNGKADSTSKEVATWAELNAEVTAVNKYSEIILTADITIPDGGTLTVPAGMTVKLNGKTLSTTKADSATAGTIAATGKIDATSGKIVLQSKTSTINGGANITGNVEVTSDVATSLTIDAVGKNTNLKLGVSYSLTGDFEIPEGAVVTLDGATSDLVIGGNTLTVKGALKTGTAKVTIAAGKIVGGDKITGKISVSGAATVDNLGAGAEVDLESGGGLTINGKAEPKALNVKASSVAINLGENASLVLNNNVTAVGAITVGEGAKLDLGGNTLDMAAAVLTVKAAGSVDNGTVVIKSGVPVGVKRIACDIETADDGAEIDGLSATSNLKIGSNLKIKNSVTLTASKLEWVSGDITIDAATAGDDVITLDKALVAQGKITVTDGTLKLGGDLTVKTGTAQLDIAANGVVDLNGHKLVGADGSAEVKCAATTNVTGLTADGSNFYPNGTTAANKGTGANAAQTTVAVDTYTWDTDVVGWVANT